MAQRPISQIQALSCKRKQWYVWKEKGKNDTRSRLKSSLPDFSRQSSRNNCLTYKKMLAPLKILYTGVFLLCMILTLFLPIGNSDWPEAWVFFTLNAIASFSPDIFPVFLKRRSSVGLKKKRDSASATQEVEDLPAVKETTRNLVNFLGSGLRVVSPLILCCCCSCDRLWGLSRAVMVGFSISKLPPLLLNPPNPATARIRSTITSTIDLETPPFDFGLIWHSVGLMLLMFSWFLRLHPILHPRHLVCSLPTSSISFTRGPSKDPKVLRREQIRSATCHPTGLFSSIRYPDLSGYLLFFLATPLILDSLVGLILSFFVFLCLCWLAVLLDDLLLSRVPDYDIYIHSVRSRLIPFLF